MNRIFFIVIPFGLVLLSLSLGVSQAFTDKYVSSGVQCHYDDPPANLKCSSFVSSGIPAGNDTTGDGSFGNPWLTIQKCFAFFGTGGSAGADGRCIARGGAYDTVNGWHAGSDTAIPSGSSFAHPFTLTAYSAGVAAGGNCTPSSMPKPGDVYGMNTCEHVVVYRSMACELASNCAFTVKQMQNTDPGCTDSAKNPADCVGAPTLTDCQDLYGTPGYPAGYTDFTNGCWTGSGVGSGTPQAGWWVVHDRTGQMGGGAVIDAAGVQTSNIFVRYVIFDGIDVDGRGVIINLISDTWMAAPDYFLVMKSYKFLNSRWQNSGASMVADSGIDNNTQFSNGQLQDADRYFINVRFTHAGIPFNTYILPSGYPGLNARENPAMKYLHAFYAHVGGNHCDYCEGDFNAGQGFATDLMNNSLTHSYLHDNEIGAQAGGNGGMDFSNNLIVNNYDIGIQGGGSIGGQAITFRNNTLVAGIKGQRSQGGGTCIQIRKDNNPGTIITNNLCSGFGVGIDNYQCGILPNNTCAYTDFPPQASNNFIQNSSSGNELRNGSSPVVNLTISNNILNQDPKFTNPSAGDYSLQSGSLAIDKGLNNGVTNDLFGNPRPVGCCIDIGALEFGSVLGPQPPDTTITSSTTNGSTPLTNPTSATTAQFAFSCSGGTSPYTESCDLDGGGFGSCTSPKSYSSLTQQQHIFSVRCTGNDALTDASPATFTWTIQANVPPNTSIDTASPSSTTTATSATFTFSASGCVGTCTFQCSLDNGAFMTCTSPQSYSGLSATCNSGVNCSHLFQVRSVDPGTGLTDPSAAQFPWTIVPAGSGTFAVGTCVQVITSNLNLRDSWPNGAINFANSLNDIEQITAQDGTLNPSGFPGLQVTTLTGANTGLTGKWHSTGCTSFSCSSNTIASTTCPNASAPDTSITSNPAASTTATVASFAFGGSGGQAPYTFECNLDSAGFTACSSVQNYSGLSVAAHNFKVRAIGADTLVDPTPASFDWTITSATPVFTQSDSKFYGLRNDANGNQVAYGTTALSVTRGGRFFVGLEVSITVGNPGVQGFLLYYSKNGGSYTALPDTCGADHICFYGVSDVSSDIKADGSAVPTCINSSNTVVGGAVSRRVASVLTPNLIQNSCVQLRWGLKFDGSETAGDTYDFRVRKQDTTVINTYTVTPRVTSIASQASGGF